MRKRSLALLMLVALLITGISTGPAESGNDNCEHKWKLISTTQPTCTEDGKKEYRCKLCGAERSKKIPALGHDWSYCTVLQQPTCTEEGVTRCYCSRDASHIKDEVQPALGHSWSKWKTVKAPRLTQPGRKERKCERCEKTETQTIPPLIQRQDYELVLQVYPAENTRFTVDSEEIVQAGPEGYSTEWVCALANTGKNDLWIRREEEDQQDRVALGAGEVILIPLRIGIGSKEPDPAQPDTIEVRIRFIGETEVGERVCESETVSQILRILSDDSADQAAAIPPLKVKQELIRDPEGSEGYRVQDTLRYSVSVTNSGDESLSLVEIRNPADGEEWPVADLMPGETRTMEMEHPVTREDAIAGYLCWAVTAEMTDPEGTEKISVQSNPLIIQVLAE